MDKQDTGPAPNPVTRLSCVKALMNYGFTYESAKTAYDAMMGHMEEAIVNHRKIYFGKTGCLVPVVRPPRKVRMGFQRLESNKVVKMTREYELGERLQYRLKLFNGHVISKNA